MVKLDHKTLGQLVVRAQNGDETAFSELYEATYKAQYFIALTNTKSAALADEVVQEVYMKLYQHLSSIKDPERVVALLNKTNYHCTLDLLAKEKANTKVDYDEVSPFIINDKIPTDSQLLADMTDKSEVKMALSQMDPGLSSILVMRYMQDMKINEIATTTGIAPRTVKRYIKKGGIQMKKIIEKIRNSNLVFAFFVSPFVNKMFHQEKQQIDSQHAAETFQHVASGLGIASSVTAAGIVTSAGLISVPLVTAGAIGIASLSGLGYVSALPQANVLYNPALFTNTTALVEVEKTGLVDLSSVEAYDAEGNLAAVLDDQGSLVFGSNGTYTIILKGTNGLTQQKTVTISSIDHTAPVIGNYTATDEAISFTVQDSQVGIDWNRVFLTTPEGVSVPYTADESTVYYSTEYPVVQVQVYDLLGNEAHTQLVLKYQETE